MKSTVNSFKSIPVNLVTLTDGEVDRDATLAAAGDAIDLYIADRETNDMVISDAAHALFDRHLGETLPSPYVLGQLLTALNAQPANQGALTVRVQEFMRSNSQGAKDKVTGLVERPDSEFVISKGAGGGCARRCDIKEVTTK